MLNYIYKFILLLVVFTSLSSCVRTQQYFAGNSKPNEMEVKKNKPLIMSNDFSLPTPITND